MELAETEKLKGLDMKKKIIGLMLAVGIGATVSHAADPDPDQSAKTVAPAAATSTNVTNAVAEPDFRPSNSIVRITAMVPAYDLMAPWAKLPPLEFQTTGCVIEGQRILTTAHGYFRDGGVIRIQRSDGGTSFIATVERINHLIDLAVLKVAKASFFDGQVPLSFAVEDFLPDGAPARAIGFPDGGPATCLSEGPVICFTMCNEKNSLSRLTPMFKLTMTNIGPGNSGSPIILADNRVAGIVRGGDSNTATVFAVPASIIRSFLAIKRPADAGKSCWIGIRYQNVSPEIRAYKKLKSGQTGQLVLKVLKTGSAYGKLKVGDVLAAVDGLAISDDGVIVLPGGRRIECGYHFGHKFGGDTLHFSVIRDGKTIELDVPATATDQPADPLLSERPFFYMYAGLVFMPMKRDLVERLCSTGWNERGVRILANSILNEGALIVSRVLPDEITEHCEPAVGECVKAIDGQEVNDLGSIRKAIESGKDPFIVIEFESGTMLVLERAEARAATERIMRRLDMVSNYSFEP